MVNPQEVLVARGAAHPGLAEAHRPREEELPLAGPRPALGGHLDAAGPAACPRPAARKDLGLLSVETAEKHADGRVVLLLLHLRDAASRHWRNGADRPRLETGGQYIDPSR